MEVFGSFWGVKRGVFGVKNDRFSRKKIYGGFLRGGIEIANMKKSKGYA